MFNFKRFQNSIIHTYRLTMTTALVAIVVGVVSYLFLVGFYAVNRNWSAPMILSPTQGKVLAFQPQIAMLEAALLKNKADLATAVQRHALFGEQVGELESLIGRFDAAGDAEAVALSRAGEDFRRVLRRKSADTTGGETAVRHAQSLLVSIDEDLAAGLVTREEATMRRLSLQTAASAITDARVNEALLRERARIDGDASLTLQGNASTSLMALQSHHSVSQLRMAMAQATIEVESARQAIGQLRVSVAQGTRVLDEARRSPYYGALTQSVPVVFAQYDNLGAARPGAPVYDCYLQIILCRRVGIIRRIYEAEEYARHPLFKSDIKGKFIGVEFDDERASRSSVVFLGRKPLLL
ncbi:hypothetical protein SAMN05216345_106198 [Cupriavidus sp. YR651]|uniref:hypothetical protein n=1 Tax=Cupriavidus sp. YR651 TaxID=1855315 RepID=UPI000886DCC8|nr:hypothetical protein [Cupriavidus sp. YR651]SDD14809.1 hypothetical protein SAMN05216345_106198 [Cupriavidus sp. YR651]